MSDSPARDHLDRQAELINALFDHHDANDKHRRKTAADGVWKNSPFGATGQNPRAAKEDDDDLEDAELLVENTERLEELVVERLDLDVSGKSRVEPTRESKVWGDDSPFGGAD